MPNNYVDKTKIHGTTYDIHDKRMPVADPVLDAGKFISVDNNGTFIYTGAVSDNIQINTSAYWSTQTSYIPESGTIIIYSDYTTIPSEENPSESINVPNFKVGDGLAFVVDLPFVSDDIRRQLSEHIANMSIHVSSQDRQKWDSKVSVITQEIGTGTGNYNLVFQDSLIHN